MSQLTTLLFLKREGELLLAMKKRGFGAGRWNGVGGKVEPDESLEQAVVRECQEEIMVTPTDFHKIAVHDFVLDSTSEQAWHMHVHTYLCTTWDGEPEETDEMAPKWFKLDNIPYDDMWADDRYWLPQALAGQKLRTRFTFDAADNVITQEIEEVPTL